MLWRQKESLQGSISSESPGGGGSQLSPVVLGTRAPVSSWASPPKQAWALGEQ